MRLALVALLALSLAGCAAIEDTPPPTGGDPTPSPYAGQESREIKALSAADIDGYRAGAGLGYAKSAELNHYPGPLHALDLREELGLTEAQERDLTMLRQEMLAEAVPLGEAYLQAEADIEDAFRGGNVTADELRVLIDRAADIEAKLRFVHLDAHLTTRALLTPEQIMKYDELRGYGTMSHDAHDAAHS